MMSFRLNARSYSSGQQGTAFTNRGNVIRGNNFTQILNHAEGTGIQSASVQAVPTPYNK